MFTPSGEDHRIENWSGCSATRRGSTGGLWAGNYSSGISRRVSRNKQVLRLRARDPRKARVGKPAGRVARDDKVELLSVQPGQPAVQHGANLGHDELWNYPTLAKEQVPRYAGDFACGLAAAEAASRPQIGSKWGPLKFLSAAWNTRSFDSAPATREKRGSENLPGASLRMTAEIFSVHTHSLAAPVLFAVQAGAGADSGDEVPAFNRRERTRGCGDDVAKVD